MENLISEKKDGKFAWESFDHQNCFTTLQLRDKRKSSFARELYFPVVSVFLINQFYHRKKELKKSNKTSVTKEKKEASNF